MSIVFLPAGTHTLDEPPHMASKLVNLVLGVCQPEPEEMEQLLDHLLECVDCQNVLQDVLKIYITAQLESHESESSFSEEGHALLARMKKITDETHLKLKEDIAPYVEVLTMHGEEEAGKRFPVLVKHLQRCKTCQSDVEGLRTFLREAEEEGLITPLHENTSSGD